MVVIALIIYSLPIAGVWWFVRIHSSALSSIEIFVGVADPSLQDWRDTIIIWFICGTSWNQLELDESKFIFLIVDLSKGWKQQVSSLVSALEIDRVFFDELIIYIHRYIASVQTYPSRRQRVDILNQFILLAVQIGLRNLRQCSN